MASEFDQPMVYQTSAQGTSESQMDQLVRGYGDHARRQRRHPIDGPVVDQAALHGLLRRVRDLGMPLVSAIRVKPP